MKVRRTTIEEALEVVKEGQINLGVIVEALGTGVAVLTNNARKAATSDEERAEADRLGVAILEGLGKLSHEAIMYGQGHIIAHLAQAGKIDINEVGIGSREKVEEEVEH